MFALQQAKDINKTQGSEGLFSPLLAPLTLHKFLSQPSTEEFLVEDWRTLTSLEGSLAGELRKGENQGSLLEDSHSRPGGGEQLF